MRWTQTLIPSLRNIPKDAEAISHQLALRAGLIRQLSSGVYSYLPLGFRVLLKIIGSFGDLRVSEEDETLGLDLSQHGESAYND